MEYVLTMSFLIFCSSGCSIFFVNQISEVRRIKVATFMFRGLLVSDAGCGVSFIQLRFNLQVDPASRCEIIVTNTNYTMVGCHTEMNLDLGLLKYIEVLHHRSAQVNRRLTAAQADCCDLVHSR
jgi:hypothetical protein